MGARRARRGTRADVATHRQYMADIAESARKALDTVDPTPYFVKYGEKTWVAVRSYLNAVTAAAAAPVIEKYTGVLAAADVFTASTTFYVMQSIRLHLGYGSQVHPLTPKRRKERHDRRWNHRRRPHRAGDGTDCAAGRPLGHDRQQPRP